MLNTVIKNLELTMNEYAATRLLMRAMHPFAVFLVVSSEALGECVINRGIG